MWIRNKLQQFALSRVLQDTLLENSKNDELSMTQNGWSMATIYKGALEKLDFFNTRTFGYFSAAYTIFSFGLAEG